jgi:hypothetical protein
MAIQPIDLQVLFLRLNQIGKEQAALQSAQTQSQTVVGSEIAQRSEQQNRAVTENQTIEGGPERVHDDESNEGQSGRFRHEREQQQSEEEDEEQQVFQDPDLGRNVDLQG